MSSNGISKLSAPFYLAGPQTSAATSHRKLPRLSTNYSLESSRSTQPPEKALLRRANQGDPTITCVSMSDGKSVEIPKGKAHTLFTYALGGCQATMLLTRHASGNHTAIMTHYPPSLHSQQDEVWLRDKMKHDTNFLTNLLPKMSMHCNTDKLRELIRKHPELKERDAQHTLLIAAPGKYKTDPKTVCPELTVEDPVLVKKLADVVKEELGKGIDISEKVLPYPVDLLKSIEQKLTQCNAFIVEFPGQAGESIRYKLCDQHHGAINPK